MPKDFRRIPANRLRWYNAMDVVTSLDVADHQRAVIGPFASTWRNLWQPAIHALGTVERWGAILSERNVVAYDDALTKGIDERRSVLVKTHALPADFKPSGNDLPELLFIKKGLSPTHKTATGKPSTAEEALVALGERYPAEQPLLADILAFKELANARSRSGKNLLKHVGYDGRVHTKYGITRSYRLNSKEPNLQNIKSQESDDVDDPGKLAKGCWVAPPGHVVVALDYGQNELRVAAMLSGDRKMAAALNGSDFHRVTASGIFGAAEDKVLKWQRRVGKETNFGIVFGQTDKGLMAKLNGLPAADRSNRTFSQAECQGYINGLLKTYPDLARWLKERVRHGDATGLSPATWGPWHHARQVPDMGYSEEDRSNRGRRHHAANVCQNGPIQTIANCFGLDALTRCVQWIEDEGVPAQLCLTVHDSLVFYAREDAWRDVAAGAKRIMLDYGTGIVNLKVDVEMGPEDYGHMSVVEV